MKESEWIPLREAAHKTGVPIAWLKREADAGRLLCLLVSRQRMFNLVVLEAELADRASKNKGQRR